MQARNAGTGADRAAGKTAAKTADGRGTGRRGLLGRMLGGWSDSTGSLEAAQLKRDSATAGCRPIDSHGDRDLVTLHGSLASVTLRPRGGVLALEADLYDGSGTVTLVWLGRRQISGIGPGRQLTVHGRLGCTDGRKVLFNPRYELAA
jgi:hypothetical protein